MAYQLFMLLSNLAVVIITAVAMALSREKSRVGHTGGIRVADTTKGHGMTSPQPSEITAGDRINDHDFGHHCSVQGS